MKAVVTGVAGFVGSNIAARLVSEGHEVLGIDSLTTYYDLSLKLRNLERLNSPSFLFVQEDLLSADLIELLKGAEVIFHEAGQPGVRSSWGKDFALYTDANINATQRLLEAAVKIPSLRRLVYASSSSVYGNAERYPTSEEDRPEPISPYGVSKLAAEHLCSLYAHNYGLPTVSLRYFTVYGPGQRPDMAFTRFCLAAANDEVITIFGNGEQVRDFTYIDDVVEANMLAAFSEVAPGTVLNVAGGSNISVNDVLSILGELNESALKVTYTGKVLGDVQRTGGSTERIGAVLGWTPKVDLRTGLSMHLAWAKSVGVSA